MNKVISHLLVIPMSISFILYVLVTNIKNKLPLFDRFEHFNKLSWMDKVNDIEEDLVNPMVKLIKERKEK